MLVCLWKGKIQFSFCILPVIFLNNSHIGCLLIINNVPANMPVCWYITTPTHPWWVGVDELWDCVGRANPHLSYTGPTAVLPFAFPIWGFYRQAYHHDNNQHGSNKGSLLANQPSVPHKKPSCWPRKANLLWTPHGLAYLESTWVFLELA